MLLDLVIEGLVFFNVWVCEYCLVGELLVWEVLCELLVKLMFKCMVIGW